jgi:branched-subunit amino acid aminotransferase/4-amino-4-deoxychorismate lyase
MSDIVILRAGESAALDPTLSGFAHGFGLFETIKLAAGRLCFWSAHWARLCASAHALRLQLDCDAPAVLDAIGELVAAQGVCDGVVKLSLLADGCGISAPGNRMRATRLFVYCRPSMSAAGPAQLQLLLDAPLNERSPLAGHKTHNYMENMLLLEAARVDGYADLIRVNTAGFVAETTVGNLFFIEGRKLFTPALGTGILAGVIRDAVLDAATALAIPVEEGLYLPEQLQHADAVFTTNSSVGIQPVEAVACDAWRVSVPSAAHPLLQSLTTALAAAEADNSIDL